MLNACWLLGSPFLPHYKRKSRWTSTRPYFYVGEKLWSLNVVKNLIKGKSSNLPTSRRGINTVGKRRQSVVVHVVSSCDTKSLKKRNELNSFCTVINKYKEEDNQNWSGRRWSLRLTVRTPDQPDGQEVLQVVEQGVFHPEALQRPDGTGTGSGHHQQGAVQADAGQRVTTGDVPGGKHVFRFHWRNVESGANAVHNNVLF